jgi:hypothetical protein
VREGDRGEWQLGERSSWGQPFGWKVGQECMQKHKQLLTGLLNTPRACE